MLWTQGASSFLATELSDRVTITGARASTRYGEQITSDLAMCLAREERVVIAWRCFRHRRCRTPGRLHRGWSDDRAVLATGVDRRYPAAHSELLDRIGDSGLLVSELPLVPCRPRTGSRPAID